MHIVAQVLAGDAKFRCAQGASFGRAASAESEAGAVNCFAPAIRPKPGVEEPVLRANGRKKRSPFASAIGMAANAGAVGDLSAVRPAACKIAIVRRAFALFSCQFANRVPAAEAA